MSEKIPKPEGKITEDQFIDAAIKDDFASDKIVNQFIKELPPVEPNSREVVDQALYVGALYERAGDEKIALSFYHNALVIAERLHAEDLILKIQHQIDRLEKQRLKKVESINQNKENAKKCWNLVSKLSGRLERRTKINDIIVKIYGSDEKRELEIITSRWLKDVMVNFTYQDGIIYKSETIATAVFNFESGKTDTEGITLTRIPLTDEEVTKLMKIVEVITDGNY